MVSKKGEMTIGLIIALAIGVIVLILLTMGITGTWGKLWDQVTNIGGGKTNIQTIEQACELRCIEGKEHEYCTLERNLNNGTDQFTVTCNSLPNDTSNKLIKGPSNINCPAIDCKK
jgi:hypothetical protein